MTSSNCEIKIYFYIKLPLPYAYLISSTQNIRIHLSVGLPYLLAAISMNTSIASKPDKNIFIVREPDS